MRSLGHIASEFAVHQCRLLILAAALEQLGQAPVEARIAQAGAQVLEQFYGGWIVAHLLQAGRSHHQFVRLEMIGLDANDPKHELGRFDAAAQLTLGDGEIGERRQGFRGTLAGVLKGCLEEGHGFFQPAGLEQQAAQIDEAAVVIGVEFERFPKGPLSILWTVL